MPPSPGSSFLRWCCIHISMIFFVGILFRGPAAAQAGACVSGPCVSTYHNDAMRDGVNSQETILTPSLFPTPDTANFGRLEPAPGGASGAVDGLIYAQPLYLSGVAMASTSGCSGTQNVVLVATENNSVYAFSWTYRLTATGYTFSLTECWKLELNQAGEFAIPFSSLPVNDNGASCNVVVPQVGITSTPVVDTTVTPPMMYVVTADQTATLDYVFRLHAISVNSGIEVTNGSKAPYNLSGVFPTGLGSNQMQQRPGLALFNASAGKANVYVSFGSFCDVSPYSGYLAGLTYNYSKQSFAPVSENNWVFDTEGGSTADNGGLWMGGAAPAVDEAGNLYVAVANGAWNGATEFGESVVKIASTSSGLFAVDYYTPNDYADLNNDLTTVTVCSAYGPKSCPATNQLTFAAPTGDFDLGAAGVTLISPAGVTSPVCGSNGELMAGGKEGVVYGVCHSTRASSKLESVMGGLDGCGYNCTLNSNPTWTACTQSATPGAGAIAQCFQGVNAGEDQKNGSNDIYDSSGIRGTQLFWAGSDSSPENYLYVAGANAALEAYQADRTTGMFNVVGAAAQTPRVFPYPGTIPSLSWNGSSPDTALLWAIDSGGFGLWHPLEQSSQAAKPAILIVYDPLPSVKDNTILQELWESSLSTDDAGPGAVKFTVPTVAGGLVFIGGGTPGYAPGLPGDKGVNCTAAALANSSTPTTCGGMLAIYGKLHD